MWRGHFIGTGAEASVNLTIDGGSGGLTSRYLHLFRMVDRMYYTSAFAASVWLNDQFLNFTDPGPSADHSNALYSFEHADVKVGEDNVITVLQVSNACVCLSYF